MIIRQPSQTNSDESLPQSPMIVEEIEITDSAEQARVKQSFEQARRNRKWLEARWSELVSQFVGKHLAVAGEEAFIGETVEEAIAQARAAHPDDQGMLVRYVSPAEGPRIYASS